MGIYSVDALSISKIGDLLVEQLGDEAADYTFPEDFEKAIVDIGFSACVMTGDSSPYTLTVINDGLRRWTGTSRNDSRPKGIYKDIKFIGNIYEIPTYSFLKQSALTEIELPDTVTIINDCAFYNCQNLSQVKMPESLQNVGLEAFRGNGSLEYIDWSSVVNLGNINFSSSQSAPSSYHFAGCPNLRTVGPGDTYNHNINGATGIASKMFANSNVTTAVIPNTCTTINGSAFYACNQLTSVTIPNSVTSIGTESFRGCNQIKTIANLDNVISLGYGAFYGCTSLESISLPSIISISTGSAPGVFGLCTSLKTVYLPKCTKIACAGSGYAIFMNCSSLENVQIGSIGHPLTELSPYVFSGCLNNTTFTIYTNANYVSTCLTRIRNDCANATIIIKAANDLIYNDVNYSAGDTILTSEVSS